MKLHNHFRCVAASLFAAATMSMANPGHAAVAAQAAPSQPASPEPAAAMASYRTLDGWIRSWSTGNQTSDAQPISIAGAHVQLRLNGELIGRGQAFAASGESGTLALREAAREAMKAAESKLQLPNDAMRDAALKDQAARLMVSLDLAGPLIAFEPATWAEAELSLSPGLEGVAAMVVGPDGTAGQLAAAFPSFLTATNTLPHRALSGLCARVIGEGGAAAALEEPAAIRARHGLRMYRFRSTHLAQCRPGAEPVFLYRGARLIDQSEITAAELWRMVEYMVRYIAQSARGVSSRSASDVRTAPVSRASLALQLVAIRGYLDSAKGARHGTGQMHARQAWDAIAGRLVATPPPEESDEDLVLALLALANPPGADPRMPDGELGGKPPVASRPYEWLEGRSWRNGKMLDGLSAPAQCASALAYARMPSSSGMDDGGKAVRRTGLDHAAAIREWIGSVSREQLVAYQPWLGWAVVEAADLGVAPGGARADIPSAISLREMRRQVWDHQIGVLDIDRDSMDLAGGIVFTKGASPLPTWQSIRPLAFIATMLRDPRLTEPSERTLELARLMQSIRFIRQLQADDSIGWMARDADLAIGGVRSAVWDQAMPPDATSMALLAITETLKSLEAMGRAVGPTGEIEASR